MRLAHCVRAIFPQHGYGGLERSATALTRHLLMEGTDVDLYTRPLPAGQPFRMPHLRLPSQARSEPSMTPGRLAVHGIDYGSFPLKPNGIPARLTNYRTFVERTGRYIRAMAYKGYIDGIYASGLCAWGVRLASEWGVPMLANPHGMEEFKVRDPFKRLAYAPFRAWVRAGCRAADRVVATDAAMVDELIRFLGVSRNRVVVLPNGVDLDEIRSVYSTWLRERLAARWTWLANREIFKGISVGRLEENKGFGYLLRALALAGKDPSFGEDWRWIFVGEGSMSTQLEALSSSLGLGANIVFAGSLTDEELHNLYAMSDLFAHPTLYEGSSLVTLEAMAHGLPVLASAVGGIPDKVIEGETGFLVRPTDPDML
ncbi:MAG: glycosyltransferase, partial [Chloroflexota bacterium]|nr:glycosyltransferase [Chloroflexota bacterium]